MNETVSFLFYDSFSNEWQPISYKELATLNDPDTAIIPVYEDGTQGEQTTWKIWDLSRQREIVQREIEYIKKQKMNISIPHETSSNPQQTTLEEAKQTTSEEAKEREMMELEHIDMLPPEVRAVDYLLRHTSLPNLIEEMRPLVNNASSLITFIIFVNIFALAVGLIAIVASIGR